MFFVKKTRVHGPLGLPPKTVGITGPTWSNKLFVLVFLLHSLKCFFWHCGDTQFKK